MMKAIITALIMTTSAAFAGGHGSSPSMGSMEIASIYVASIHEETAYELRYVNHNSESEGERTSEELLIGTVTWDITSTPNDPCMTQGQPAEICADTIVITPPTGYIVIPAGPITINESTYIDVLIIPEGLS